MGPEAEQVYKSFVLGDDEEEDFDNVLWLFDKHCAEKERDFREGTFPLSDARGG